MRTHSRVQLMEYEFRHGDVVQPLVIPIYSTTQWETGHQPEVLQVAICMVKHVSRTAGLDLLSGDSNRWMIQMFEGEVSSSPYMNNEWYLASKESRGSRLHRCSSRRVRWFISKTSADYMSHCEIISLVDQCCPSGDSVSFGARNATMS